MLDILDKRQERIHAWDKANYWEGAATADGLAGNSTLRGRDSEGA